MPLQHHSLALINAMNAKRSDDNCSQAVMQWLRELISQRDCSENIADLTTRTGLPCMSPPVRAVTDRYRGALRRALRALSSIVRSVEVELMQY